mgnify:CR=1 FL=1
MIILLYKPGAPDAFAKYDSSCEVRIVEDVVYVYRDEEIVERFRLSKKCNPVWTDETKVVSEIMVKIIVEPIEVLEALQ